MRGGSPSTPVVIASLIGCFDIPTNGKGFRVLTQKGIKNLINRNGKIS